MSLDLNMGYYHIFLIKQARNLCTIILHWGQYRYKRLPIGVSNYLDIFQDKMNEMFHGFDFIWEYINDLLIITKGDRSDNLTRLELIQQKLKDNGLKCNIKKSFFGQT